LCGIGSQHSNISKRKGGGGVHIKITCSLWFVSRLFVCVWHSLICLYCNFLGWKGLPCESQCPKGFYGKECQARCKCQRIYNYLSNQCLSPLLLWVRISIRVSCTTLCDKVCQWLAAGHWFSPGTPVSSTNKTDRHDITEILLEVVIA
jgi:hypothetical protein